MKHNYTNSDKTRWTKLATSINNDHFTLWYMYYINGKFITESCQLGVQWLLHLNKTANEIWSYKLIIHSRCIKLAHD